ncbi:hypothetical protein D5085_09865 [Ectothiorhodospiraceae bacterium BW-2]|nr:hypothetical protein D5085_09865 [Ectothiorhodospiraceae bacterium BW-2]
MQRLLFAFIELVLLQRPPQSLPANSLLFVLAVGCHGLTGWLIGRLSLAPELAAVAALYGTFIVLLYMVVLLEVAQKRIRLMQSLTALLGGEAVIGIVALPIVYVSLTGESGGVAALLSLSIVIWNLLFAAHIFRHTLADGKGSGMTAAVLYMVTSLLLGAMLPLEG